MELRGGRLSHWSSWCLSQSGGNLWTLCYVIPQTTHAMSVYQPPILCNYRLPILCQSTDHPCYASLQTTCAIQFDPELLYVILQTTHAMPVCRPFVLYQSTDHPCYASPWTTCAIQFDTVLYDSTDHPCYANLQTTHALPVYKPPMLCDSVDHLCHVIP
jgi:hypothetical protein